MNFSLVLSLSNFSIQTQIIKWIGEQGSIIGVIGDPAQSIYKFQGASRDDFIKFNLHNQKDYIMTQNRRVYKRNNKLALSYERRRYDQTKLL